MAWHKIYTHCVAITLFAAWWGMCLPSSTAQENSASTKEVVDDPHAWDFGRVKKGSIVNHDFIVKNSLNRPMRITNVSTSCGCTVSEVKKKLLAPNEETMLAVQFNSTDYDGRVQQFVYVATDNLDNPIIRFIIKATVIK